MRRAGCDSDDPPISDVIVGRLVETRRIAKVSIDDFFVGYIVTQTVEPFWQGGPNTGRINYEVGGKLDGFRLIVRISNSAADTGDL